MKTKYKEIVNVNAIGKAENPISLNEILRKAFNCLSKSVIESSKSVMSDDADDFFQI